MRNHIEILSKIKPFKKKIIISSDKSISIRSVLLASQAIGESRLYNLLESEDVINTLKSISKLGIKYKKEKNYDRIHFLRIITNFKNQKSKQTKKGH